MQECFLQNMLKLYHDFSISPKWPSHCYEDDFLLFCVRHSQFVIKEGIYTASNRNRLGLSIGNHSVKRRGANTAQPFPDRFIDIESWKKKVFRIGLE